MATKSFLKNVHLHGRKQMENFIKALESSKESHPKQVIMSRQVKDMTPDEMRKIFSKEMVSK